MKKYLTILFLVAALFASCTREEFIDTDGLTPETVYTMTVKVTKASDPATRGLVLNGKTLNVKWNAGETVDVIQEGESKIYHVGTLTAKASDNGSTTLTGTITPHTTDAEFRLCLHGYSEDYTGQTGMLLKPAEGEDNSIESKYDYAIAEIPSSSVTIGDGNNTVTIEGTVSFVNQQAIVKFSLYKDDGTTPLNASKMIIHGDGPNLVTVFNAMEGVIGSRGNLVLDGLSGETNEIYMAINQGNSTSIRSENLTFTAYDANGMQYIYGPKNVSFENGKYYEVKVSMKVNPSYKGLGAEENM